MMLMPANHSSPVVHYLSGRHPGRIGWLIGPSARFKTKLRKWMPFALDNDAFSAWSKSSPLDVNAWRALLLWAKQSGQIPLWALVPDVVADRAATLAQWERYAPEVEAIGWPLAFAVQDGMTPDDVPGNASVVFVGGTSDWKWRTVPTWTRQFKRVHVGRVNELRRLWTCEDHGVESVDGTGWFRDSDQGRRVGSILQWIEGDRQESEPLPFLP